MVDLGERVVGSVAGREAAGLNARAGETQAVQLLVDGRHRRRLNRDEPGAMLTGPLEAAEEERPILLNGAAERETVLALRERVFARAERRARVQPPVAQKPEERSVQVVRAGAGEDVDVSGGAPSELG